MQKTINRPSPSCITADQETERERPLGEHRRGELRGYCHNYYDSFYGTITGYNKEYCYFEYPIGQRSPKKASK
ncbi:hypothetical protein E2C01_029257 [Portunus trituberculatus]|uniref:Uncharacterized protein n=1 Tax=Portunus trituberculatus TaxID=210409 RepID=A0A5B7EMJ3_PORTR|nr:hypothetical protein [Portunus trituberculatus]